MNEFRDPRLGWGPPPMSASPSRRHWAGISFAAAGGAAVATLITFLVSTHIASQHNSPSGAAVIATATVTATPPPPPSPKSLPTGQADRQTCNAWHDAGDRIHDASHALATIPNASTILDPQVRDDPVLSEAVRNAARSYDQAGTTLAAGIAAGTTPVLYQSATSAAAALHALAIGDGTFDAAAGNTYHVVREAADTLDVLCNRLAPR